MVRSVALVAIAGLILGMVGGCKREKETAETQPSVSCPGCGVKAEAGTFCPECTAVASTGKTVHCDKCDKDFKEGQYCPACNAFMFDEEAECQKCGATASKGALCEKCKVYTGLPDVGYCEEHKKPFKAAEGCPACKAAEA
ncbi:MAG: hypothetical protein ACYTF6_02820 [Planctomycetota bacterium]|jgi:hypothetical protein